MGPGASRRGVNKHDFAVTLRCNRETGKVFDSSAGSGVDLLSPLMVNEMPISRRAIEVFHVDLLGFGGGVDPYLHFEDLLPLPGLHGSPLKKPR
jgi:hypothetical protein